MSLSLKDQLIAAGLVKRDAAKPKPAPRPAKYPTHALAAKPPPAKPVEPSLAELYRARDLATQKELQEAQRLNVEKALAKRARKNQALALVAGKAVNTKLCDQGEGEQVVRHFEYARKIRRIYLSAEQRTQLNAGELGIVQLDGHFSLLPHAIMVAVHSVAPEFIALMGASAEAVLPVEDPAYSDSKHQIPDDLTW